MKKTRLRWLKKNSSTKVSRYERKRREEHKTVPLIIISPQMRKETLKNSFFCSVFALPRHATHNVPIIYVLLLLLRDFCFKGKFFFPSSPQTQINFPLRYTGPRERKTSRVFPRVFRLKQKKGLKRKRKKSWKRNSSPCAFHILSAAFPLHADGKMKMKMKSYISLNCIRCV